MLLCFRSGSIVTTYEIISPTQEDGEFPNVLDLKMITNEEYPSSEEEKEVSDPVPSAETVLYSRTAAKSTRNTKKRKSICLVDSDSKY